MSKKVYLTIDDAPTKDFKDKFTYLRDKNIPAVFFCIGENIRKYEKDVIAAVKDGFIIGNHSLRHNYFSDMSIDECKESILETDKIINGIYKKAGITRKHYLIRFPHFDRGGEESSKQYENKFSRATSEWFIYPDEDKVNEVQFFLQELGYKQPDFIGLNLQYFVDKDMLNYIDVRCTFDQMEFLLDNPNAPYGLTDENAILHRIDEDEPYWGRSLNRNDTSDIILVHDMEHTTQLFYKIIDKYICKSFEFMEIN